MKPVMQLPLSDEMRSLLIIEILNDMGKVHEGVLRLEADLQTISLATQDQAQDLLRWRQALDQKILELDQINLSTVASERLNQHARDYLRALSKEVTALVELEVKGQTSAQVSIPQSRIGWLEFGGAVVAVLMGNLVWAALAFLAH